MAIVNDLAQALQEARTDILGVQDDISTLKSTLDERLPAIPGEAELKKFKREILEILANNAAELRRQIIDDLQDLRRDVNAVKSRVDYIGRQLSNSRV